VPLTTPSGVTPDAIACLPQSVRSPGVSGELVCELALGPLRAEHMQLAHAVREDAPRRSPRGRCSGSLADQVGSFDSGRHGRPRLRLPYVAAIVETSEDELEPVRRPLLSRYVAISGAPQSGQRAPTLGFPYLPIRVTTGVFTPRSSRRSVRAASAKTTPPRPWIPRRALVAWATFGLLADRPTEAHLAVSVVAGVGLGFP
jgi:hypothetical protein